MVRAQLTASTLDRPDVPHLWRCPLPDPRRSPPRSRHRFHPVRPPPTEGRELGGAGHRSSSARSPRPSPWAGDSSPSHWLLGGMPAPLAMPVADRAALLGVSAQVQHLDVRAHGFLLDVAKTPGVPALGVLVFIFSWMVPHADVIRSARLVIHRRSHACLSPRRDLATLWRVCYPGHRRPHHARSCSSPRYAVANSFPAPQRRGLAACSTLAPPSPALQ